MESKIINKDRSTLDLLPFPALVTNKQGKIIFKNKLAYKMKILSINRSFSLMLRDDQFEIFAGAVSSKSTVLLRCTEASGFTHAAVVPIEDDEFVIYLAMCSVSVKKLFEFGEIELIYETFRINSNLFKSYLKLCEKHKREKPSGINEIIQCNNLRFSRCSRLLSMYIHSLTKKERIEKEETVDLKYISQNVCDYFSKKVVPLGFRLNYECDDVFIATKLQKSTFVTIFLELATVAMRLAANKKCRIKMYKSHGKIFAEYSFVSTDDNFLKATYSMETNYTKAIAEFCGWKLTDIDFIDGSAFFVFSFPEKIEPQTTISSSKFTLSFDKDELHEICDAVFTNLYFA